MTSICTRSRFAMELESLLWEPSAETEFEDSTGRVKSLGQLDGLYQKKHKALYKQNTLLSFMLRKPYHTRRVRQAVRNNNIEDHNLDHLNAYFSASKKNPYNNGKKQSFTFP